MKARKVLDDVHNDISDNHYGPLPKAVILDYLERKEKEEKEREAKINAITSISESVDILRQQNKILREQVETIKADSLAAKRKAKSATAISIISLSISGAMMLIALITLLLKL